MRGQLSGKQVEIAVPITQLQARHRNLGIHLLDAVTARTQLPLRCDGTPRIGKGGFNLLVDLRPAVLRDG